MVVHGVVPGYLVSGGGEIIAVGFGAGTLVGVGGFMDGDACHRPLDPGPAGSSFRNKNGMQRNAINIGYGLPLECGVLSLAGNSAAVW